jgi:hypothetical protein
MGRKRKIVTLFSKNAKIESASEKGENLFKSRLFVEEAKPEHCVAMVLPNELCLLFLPDNLCKDAKTCIFDNSLMAKTASVELTGKKKKGAVTLEVDSRVCTIVRCDGESINILSPLRGKVLELNDKLIEAAKEAVQQDGDSFERGYLAVVSPMNALPPAGTDLTVFEEHRKVCHEWLKTRTCARGDACIFDHPTETENT